MVAHSSVCMRVCAFMSVCVFVACMHPLQSAPQLPPVQLLSFSHVAVSPYAASTVSSWQLPQSNRNCRLCPCSASQNAPLMQFLACRSCRLLPCHSCRLCLCLENHFCCCWFAHTMNDAVTVYTAFEQCHHVLQLLAAEDHVHLVGWDAFLPLDVLLGATLSS